MSIKSALLSCALLVVAACGDDGDPLPNLPCDVRTRSCQRAVWKATKATRGQNDARLPPIRVISRKELEDELRAELTPRENEVDPVARVEENQHQLAMSLLGLAPPPSEQSSIEAYIEQAIDSLAAYYTTVSKDITIVADQVDDEENGTITLSHELLHALQDQREDLDKWRNGVVRSSDSYVASKSLTEGEATWLSNVTYGDRAYGLAPEAIAHEQLFGRMLSGMLSYLEERGEAPLLAAQELLPYPVGGRFVADVHLNEGLPGLAGLYDALPPALVSFVDPSVMQVPESLDCDLPPPPAGYELLSTDQLGFAGAIALHIALQEAGRTSFEAALDWRSDEVAVYVAPGNEQEVAVAWRIRLTREQDATQLASNALQKTSIVARAQGHEVLITASSNAALRDTWKPDEAPCKGPEKGRAPKRAHTVRRSPLDALGIVR